MRKMSILVTISLLGALLLALFCTSTEDPAFVQEEEAWRQAREENMQKPNSWLTIAGLYWLKEGENRFGTAPDNDIQLPEGSAPAQVGKFVRHGDQIRFEAHKNLPITIEGKTVRGKTLRSDTDGKPDILELNELRMWVIKREDRYAIRMRDFNAPAFKEYKGLTFFPPRQKYRVKGTLIPYESPKTVTVPTAVGTKSEMISPGLVSFQIGKKKHTLQAFGAGPDAKSLFFVLRDGTSREETYGASRFMTANVLEDGTFDMNFNRAYNPPCAYTKFATCPLPPPENILSVRIEAGEMIYGH